MTQLLWSSLSFRDVGSPLSVTPPIAEKESQKQCGIGKARDFCVHSSSRHTRIITLKKFTFVPLSSLFPLVEQGQALGYLVSSRE